MKKRWIFAIILVTPPILVAAAVSVLLLKRPPKPEQVEPLVPPSEFPVATDMALQTGFQDSEDGHFSRGRALLAADFDLDGRVDFFVGNPKEKSFILHNVASPDGGYHFERTQVLLDGALAWGGAVSDFDNDGDYDIFVSSGANEGIGYDYLFRNDFKETGQLHFTDVTELAGVAGPHDPDTGKPLRTASGNARIADFDQDGDDDIFVNTNYLGVHGKVMRILRHGLGDYTFKEVFSDPVPGRNTLWRNDGNLKFTDVTSAVGLDRLQTVTRNSTWLDVDNDGDMDLYENNMGGPNTLWRNHLHEDGKAVFTDDTAKFASATDNPAYPIFSFVSAAADINNDGWEDIIAFYHHKPNSAPKEDGPYQPGHAIYINQAGKGFKNIGDQTGINQGIPVMAGVMGCQVGDISGDGIPDIFFGNGDPFKGTESQIYLSDQVDGQLHYRNASSMINFPAPQQPGLDYPPSPYRTHGTAFVDVDNDGQLEVAILEGGPANSPDSVREPNRLFKLGLPFHHYLKVNLKGDGEHVSKDAIGSRLALTLADSSGQQRTLYSSLYGGSCFSAHNSFTVHFYLRDNETIQDLNITWPNGRKQQVNDPMTPDSLITVNYSS